MPFYLYKRTEKKEGKELKECFEKVNDVKLAGYNAIYNLWLKKGQPINEGWHISLEELILELTEGQGNPGNHRLLIDFDPGAKWRIGLIEMLSIYAYTFGDRNDGVAHWTPLMFSLRDVWVEEFDKDIEFEEKDKMIDRFSIPKRQENDYERESVEFVYLKGQDGDWNWGRVGQVNATFVFGPARDYFRKYF